MMVADDIVCIPFTSALTANRALPVRSRSRTRKDGYVATISSNHGMIITGLRPKRSDSQPPRASQTSPLAPAAPRATLLRRRYRLLA